MQPCWSTAPVLGLQGPVNSASVPACSFSPLYLPCASQCVTHHICSSSLASSPCCPTWKRYHLSPDQSFWEEAKGFDWLTLKVGPIPSRLGGGSPDSAAKAGAQVTVGLSPGVKAGAQQPWGTQWSCYNRKLGERAAACPSLCSSTSQAL